MCKYNPGYLNLNNYSLKIMIPLFYINEISSNIISVKKKKSPGVVVQVHRSHHQPLEFEPRKDRAAAAIDTSWFWIFGNSKQSPFACRLSWETAHLIYNGSSPRHDFRNGYLPLVNIWHLGSLVGWTALSFEQHLPSKPCLPVR